MPLPHPTRRQTLAMALAAAGSGVAIDTSVEARSDVRTQRKNFGPTSAVGQGLEGQRRADLGDGRYTNPIIAGDHPDPNILKDGDDYYATFSSFLYYPGVPIWHSRDLVNWTPLTAALTRNIGSVWALDIAKHDGRYFIYIPALDATDATRPLKIYVIHAPTMAGPWSDPIDLKIDNLIDPGHAIGEDGRRYLFFNGGNRVQLSDDGLSTVGAVSHVYDGWPIPQDWIIEGFALEGPKITRRGGWFYMFSGQGGTAGPPTSHMVVVARSRSINGPWENCPHNPIVRTASRDEPWWSRGHATAVEGPDGRWWLVYHGYENGLRTLGRQMLLEPMAWTADGWPRAMGGTLSKPLVKPARGTGAAHGQRLSGFGPGAIGNKLTFFAPTREYLKRAVLEADTLKLAGQGTGPGNSSPLLFVAGDRSYEIELEVEVEPGTEAGLVLFYDEKLFCGVGLDGSRLHAYRIGQEERWPPGTENSARRLFFKLINDENVVTFLYGNDGRTWAKERSYEVGGYNHNVADGFLSLRPGIYAARGGQATFRSLSYRARGMVQDKVALA